MPGPWMTLNEVADMMGFGFSSANRCARTKRFLHTLEVKYGVTLLVKMGGKVKAGRWFVPRSTLKKILEPEDGGDALRVMELLKSIEDLKMRVEELERQQHVPSV